MIHNDIHRAHTLPASFYVSDQDYDKVLKNAYLKSWQLLDPALDTHHQEDCVPFTLLPGSLNEPLILSRNNGRSRVLSNVCTHRAMILMDKPSSPGTIRCPYHGRCFDLDGTFKSMPEFQGIENFPTPEDDLKTYEIHSWGPLQFTSLDPMTSFNKWIGYMAKRLNWYPFSKLKYSSNLSKDYHLNANWALYCDNYLEGFHVPFVHEKLNKVLQYSSYQVDLFDQGVLQTGIAQDGEEVLDIPPGHPDHEKSVYAYYFFLFPNLMINVYHWGLSINLIEPQGKDKTRVRFFSFLQEGKSELDFDNTYLHQTELEDEDIVEKVQKGVESFSYRKGRYSPKQEKGVHHFHRWISRFIME